MTLSIQFKEYEQIDRQRLTRLKEHLLFGNHVWNVDKKIHNYKENI